MPKIVRTTLLGLSAFLGWLGFSFLVLILAGKTLAPMSESWVYSFPVFAALPALLLAGGVASYFARENWLSSSAVAGTAAVCLLWLFASFSGVWWAVVPTTILGVALAVGSGYVVQFALRRVRR